MSSSYAERQARALARAAHNPHGVRPGQRWQDWDSRYRSRLAPRFVTVLAIEGAFALVETSRGAKTRVRLDRFRPSSTGYRLVADPHT